MWSGSPVSSNLRVEVCRFIPSFAAHAAVAFEADPTRFDHAILQSMAQDAGVPEDWETLDAGSAERSLCRAATREILRRAAGPSLPRPRLQSGDGQNSANHR